MDEEVMREMVESGCVQIRYGIESGSNHILRRIKKGFTIEKAQEIVERSLKYFPSVHVSFIWGYPFEELMEFEKTLRWVSRFEESGATVLLFEYSPLPGSELYQEHHQGLSFLKHSYSSFVMTGHEIVKPGYFKSPTRHNPVYRLIFDHPEIFSGFYSHENMSVLRKKQKLEHFNTTRRTPASNAYDF
jgi:radical SAM superfamily enzyme YgiQ (UPF0313 family)